MLRLVTLKFGPPSVTLRERIATASVEELDRLAEKILFVPNVEALFGD